ncbi:MAG: 2-C-methyl-D-erythritol 4-phosphate cytidylyltransferase [Thermoanaerobaculia bacterium]|nr:2-C-methyl-D-erythritol 4-phosphate cytidylyltransferase [Thermoanaerobaculia bacterium]
MSTAAVVLAAGRGVRLAAGTPKAFVPLAGAPLLLHALRALAAAPSIDLLVPVIPTGERARYDALAEDLAEVEGLTEAVEGGAERQDSVRAGVAALGPGVEWVAVHDAARALVRPEAVERVVAAARRHGAAILAAPARDTVKRVRDGRIVETPPRAECWVAQTPQVFRTEVLREALAKAHADGTVATDDAQLVERLGVPVHVVEGDPDNLKITGPDDLAAADAWLRARGGEA